MKRILISAIVLLLAGAFFILAGGESTGLSGTTYKIEFDNAFGLVQGADFRVAGAKAGKIQNIDLDEKTLHAVVTVKVTQTGFGQFHQDAFCQSRPQSLIGEYYVECQPGNTGPVLKPGATIPVTRTESTIPADLLQNIMRMPYRERFTLIINELGAGVAARSDDIQSALKRAVPALTETDNLLNLLANDSHTLQSLTVNSDTVLTALANNSGQVQRFIDESDRISGDTAAQQANLRSTLADLPPFLEQLRPSLAQLSQVTDANTPVLENLNSSAGEINRLFTDLPGFSRSATPAIKALGEASVPGREAVIAAGPTVKDLTTFAKATPELAQNLAIILRDLDNRGRATEADSRSPGGQGYTGLEAPLQFLFNTAQAINTFGPFGHELAVDLFADPECTPYATRATVAMSLAKYGSEYRHCYSWLGPDQPGVSTPDPSNPGACVPDPGGSPPGEPGAPSSACKLSASDVQSAARDKSTAAGGTPAAKNVSSGSGVTGSATPTAQRSVAQPAASGGSGSGGGGSSGGSGQTQQLLNYLLAP